MADKRQYVVETIASLVKGTKSERVQTAEMIVDRLQEEGVLHLGYGNAEIDEIVTTFSEVFGNTKTSKYDRFSAQRLNGKYGSQAIVGIIKLLGALRTEKYAPVVNNLSQLEDKMPSILNFLRKHKGEETIDV